MVKTGNGDMWAEDELARRAELNAAGERRRRERWAEILNAHGEGVLQWTAARRTRFERIAERFGAWTRGLFRRRRRPPASSWPWRRWHGVLVAPLEPEDCLPQAETREDFWEARARERRNLRRTWGC